MTELAGLLRALRARLHPCMEPPSTIASGGGWRQLGALTLDDTGRVTSVRIGCNTPFAYHSGDGKLVHTVPPGSLPFLNAACLEEQTKNGDAVALFVLDAELHHEASGFTLSSWSPPLLTLVCTEAIVPGEVSTLDVLRAWGMDVSTHTIAFSMATTGDSYVPQALLHNALSPGAVEWCAPAAGRLGASCLLDTFPSYPPRTAFARARAFVSRHRYPLLLVYGAPMDPDASGAEEINAGLQGILVHPVKGEIGRVHFVRVAGTMQIAMGELGDQPLDASSIN